jgi:hypothetical protein
MLIVETWFLTLWKLSIKIQGDLGRSTWPISKVDSFCTLFSLSCFVATCQSISCLYCAVGSLYIKITVYFVIHSNYRSCFQWKDFELSVKWYLHSIITLPICLSSIDPFFHSSQFILFYRRQKYRYMLLRQTRNSLLAMASVRVSMLVSWRMAVKLL